MKALLVGNIPTSSTLSITVEPELASIGDGRSNQSTIDFVEQSRTDEIIGVTVEEKRKRDESYEPRRIRPRRAGPELTQESSPPQPPTQSTQPSERTEFSSKPAKFHLASDLQQKVNISDIGEKVMDTPIQIRLRELFAASSDVSNYIDDQTRERRIPVDGNLPQAPDTNLIVANVKRSQYEYQKSYYASSSGRAKVTKT
jgi:hypothetical protein